MLNNRGNLQLVIQDHFLEILPNLKINDEVISDKEKALCESKYKVQLTKHENLQPQCSLGAPFPTGFGERPVHPTAPPIQWMPHPPPINGVPRGLEYLAMVSCVLTLLSLYWKYIKI